MPAESEEPGDELDEEEAGEGVVAEGEKGVLGCRSTLTELLLA